MNAPTRVKPSPPRYSAALRNFTAFQSAGNMADLRAVDCKSAADVPHHG